MALNSVAVAALSDESLLATLKALAHDERRATARLLAALAEMDRRKLYLAEGFPSLFVYCTRVLHLAEHAAYNRIEAARAARRWPVILELVADGSLTLSAVRILAPQLTDANHRAVLAAATHKGKRDVEQQVAALRPLPDVPSSIRKLPVPAAKTAVTLSMDVAQGDASLPPTMARSPAPGLIGVEAAPESAQGGPGLSSACESLPSAATCAQLRPAARSVLTPLAPDRFKIQFTIGRETHDRLRQAQDLLRHTVPDGDPAVIFDRALALLVADLERTRMARADRPRAKQKAPGASSRHVPASVRRDVWRRDGGQCAFIGRAGRCPERGFLELHHVIPFAEHGPATVENLELRCRAHNSYEDAVRTEGHQAWQDDEDSPRGEFA